MVVLCVVIGYFCGCFLTAQLVAKYKTGRGADRIGSGNPGTANIGRLFGAKWALVTLAGDVLKTMLPVLFCRFIFFPAGGELVILYVGLGVTLGHGFPFYRWFKGGKGVAVTCTYLILFDPLWGVVACILGFFVVMLSGYLTVGALAIPLFAAAFAFYFHGVAAGSLLLAATGVLIYLHRFALQQLITGHEQKSSLWLKGKKR